MAVANIHEKRLSDTDAKSKFSVPAALLRELVPVPRPGHEETIQVKDEWGNGYIFRLKVRVTQTPDGYLSLKAEFKLRECNAFVVEKQLKAGEFVYFWLDDRARILRVQARIPPYVLRLFGNNFIA